MAHFAQVADGFVQQVIVVGNDDAPTEAAGQAFIANTLKLGGVWIQTSYNANFRGKYAGIGDLWNGTEFTTPKASDDSVA